MIEGILGCTACRAREVRFTSRPEAAVGDGGFFGEGLTDLGDPLGIESKGRGDGVVQMFAEGSITRS